MAHTNKTHRAEGGAPTHTPLTRARESSDRYAALIGKIFPVQLYTLNLVQRIHSEVVFAACDTN